MDQEAHSQGESSREAEGAEVRALIAFGCLAIAMAAESGYSHGVHSFHEKECKKNSFDEAFEYDGVWFCTVQSPDHTWVNVDFRLRAEYELEAFNWSHNGSEDP